MVRAEVDIVRRRINDRMSTEAVLMQATIASVLAGGDALKKALRELQEDG